MINIRKELIFTAEMRPLVTERLDLVPVGEVPRVEVRMRNARHRLHPKLTATDLWTYDGHFPGKIFFVRSDQTIAVEWINEIDGTLPFSVVESGYAPIDPTRAHPGNEPGAFDGAQGQAGGRSACKPDLDAMALNAWTVVHLHGARVRAESDGWTENAFLPRNVQAASQRSLYPPQPRSMMLWYHDHAYTITRLNVFAGLAGGWVIRDDEEQALNLPADEFELPLIIQDRNFEIDEKGCLSGRLLHKVETDSTKFVPSAPTPAEIAVGQPGSTTPPDTAEFFGPFTLVNGSLWPWVSVKPMPYRLRVLNGSNARTYQLFLVDETNQCRNDLIRQIGTDAGLMASAVSIDSLKYPAYTQSPVPNQNTQNLNFCAGRPKGLILAPAERVDLIVDFQRAPGQKLRWVNVAAAPFDGYYAAVDGSTDPTKPQPVDPSALPENILALGSRLPFPEVMRFDVSPGQMGEPLKLPAVMSSFHRLTHDSPELAGHKHRWLALNEKLKGSNFQDGFLFFNELIELVADDARKEEFTITLADDGTTHRFLNRPAFFRSPVNFYPEAGKPEVWHLVNFSADSHPIHLHLVDFQILSRYSYVIADPGGQLPILSIVSATNSDGLLVPDPVSGPHVIVPNPSASNAIDDNEVGWKDSVRVNPNEIVTIGMVFEGFTGRFMYHCHILEHEDMDMMRPMVVVPSTVKKFVADMQIMADDEPDEPGMSGMAGMQ